MALDLHLQMKDGTTAHVDCTQTAWNSWIRDERAASQWAHEPGDCPGEFQLLLESRRLARRILNMSKSALLPNLVNQALRQEPAGIEIVVTAPLPVEIYLISWPPTHAELTPYEFGRMTHWCLADATDILKPWLRARPIDITKLDPLADKRGQFLMF